MSSCGCKPDVCKAPLKVVCCPPKPNKCCCKPKCPPPKDPCAPKIPRKCSCEQILQWQKNGRAMDSVAAPAVVTPAVAVVPVVPQDQILYRDVGF